jgi:hypothetical protein
MVEAFLRAVLKLDGPPSEVREAVRIDLAEYEKLFRDDENRRAFYGHGGALALSRRYR